jgi:hypothetical protein
VAARNASSVGTCIDTVSSHLGVPSPASSPCLVQAATVRHIAPATSNAVSRATMLLDDSVGFAVPGTEISAGRCLATDGTSLTAPRLC